MFHGDVSLEIARGLKALSKRIEAARVPPSQFDKTLNLATWNIRKFGTKRRTQAAIHYIAEILGQFDVVSIVELDEDLIGSCSRTGAATRGRTGPCFVATDLPPTRSPPSPSSAAEPS